MATVITSIGSNGSITTATPSSCGGGSGTYTVTFPSAPSGVSVGDMAQMTDEASYYATFTYRVSVVAGSTLTFVFVSEDSEMVGETSPCDLLDMSWNQAEAEFSRYYTTLNEWETDLGNSLIYDSGDDGVGEIHNDSVFDESLSISGLSSLNSLKLTVHPDSRHTGIAGTGARIVRTGSTANTPMVLGCNNLTVEWLEIDCTDATDIPNAVEINGSALENVYLRNMILHDLDPDDNVTSRAGVMVTNSTADTVTRYILNNFIYNIKRTAVTAEPRDCVAVGQTSTGTSVDKGADLYNNTIRGVSTTDGTAYGYEFSPSTTAINNIAISCGDACFKVSDDSSGSTTSSHNLSDDNTAGDLGSTENQLTAQTSDTGVVTLYTLVSSTNLHLRYVAGYPISLGVDRGTRLNAPDGILVDIDGDARAYGIPNVLMRGYWDIGADESVYSHPFPATADAATAYTPPIVPAAAVFELAAVSPTVTIVRPSVSITPVVAALVLAAVSPTVAIGYPSVSITPAAATFELAAVSPSVSIPVSVTPAAASFELAGVSPSAVAGSLSVTPAVGAVEFAGVTPSVQLSSISLTPSAAAFELAGISPTVSISSAAITPAVAVVEFAGVSPSVGMSSMSVTPSASAFELAGISPSVALSSLSVTPSVAAVEFAGISPSVQLSSISLTPSVAALELAGVSPSVTTGSVSVTPSAAATNYRARYAAVIAGGIIVVPVAEAQFVCTAVDPAVGMSSQSVAVAASAFELEALSPSVISGSISLTPAVAVVEFAGSVGTILAGVEVTPAVAAFEYVVGSFTLHVTMDSASLGYSCDGLVDYRGSIPCDYEITGVLDYIGGVLPTDYSLEKNLDYRYDHNS